MPRTLPKRLNIGCGYDKRADYLNIDVDPKTNPDLLITSNDLSQLPAGYFEEVLAMDVLEHIPRAETTGALLYWAERLKMEGKLTLETSNVLGVARMMETHRDYASHHGWTICLFGNQVHSGDFHHSGFTEITLTVCLAAAGFTIESMQMKDEWLLDVIARKTEDWTITLQGANDLPIPEFIRRSFAAALDRQPLANEEVAYHDSVARGALKFRQVLHALYASPERLYVTAKRLGL